MNNVKFISALINNGFRPVVISHAARYKLYESVCAKSYSPTQIDDEICRHQYCILHLKHGRQGLITKIFYVDGERQQAIITGPRAFAAFGAAENEL